MDTDWVSWDEAEGSSLLYSSSSDSFSSDSHKSNLSLSSESCSSLFSPTGIGGSISMTSNPPEDSPPVFVASPPGLSIRKE